MCLYLHCALKDPRMTQLLADLYFNSTLEQLERVTPKETSFVAVIGDLQNVLKVGKYKVLYLALCNLMPVCMYVCICTSIH